MLDNAYEYYDSTNPSSIEKHGQKLIGHTFREVLAQSIQNNEILNETIDYFDNPYAKGGLGTLIEQYHYHFMPNNEAEADFPEAMTELKTTPYELTKTGKRRAGERLVISMIPNREPISSNFYESELLRKIHIIMFVVYLRDRSKKRTEYTIDYAKLFSIFGEGCKEDLAIIIEDYNTIVRKIQAGKAHELSESDTLYLGACTKGATAKSSMQPQYYNPSQPAKRRAFSFKQSYMTAILNTYLVEDVSTYDAIFSAEDLAKTTFENALIDKINVYVGQSEQVLYELFGVRKDHNKSANSQLILRMLKVNTENAAEFAKANIEIKTIRVNRWGMPRESMSFPTFNILDFINEKDFEDTSLYKFFAETKLLFVVFREGADGQYYLKGAKLWNMPITDLEKTGRKEWSIYQKSFSEGVSFKIQTLSNGQTRVENTLPKEGETTIFHVRPHARKSAYSIRSLDFYKGDIAKDGDRLPNGDYMTKQCFWLNKSYVRRQIEELL